MRARLSNSIAPSRYSIASRFSCLILAGLLISAGSAFGQSGGLYLPENGGPLNGTAQAGSAAIARDAETAWLNPAGMTRLDSIEVILTVMPFYGSIEFNPSPETTLSGTNGGNQGGWLAGAALFFAAPVSERVALGLSLTSPAGLILDPDDDWVGRTWTTKSTLIALNIEPSVGWRLSDAWSVGLGLDIQYLNFQQEMTGPLSNLQVGIDGDSWNVGVSPSLLWEPKDTTRFGLRYRSSIAHDLSGDLNIVNTRSVSTSFTMPMSLTLSAYHQFKATFAMMADLGWTDWSAFDNNVISFDSGGNPVELARNFKDTWAVNLGAHFVPSANWLLMVGGGYVSSAVDDENRTPDLPVDQQLRFSFGGERRFGQRWTVGLNYTYAWLGNNPIDQTRPINRRIAGDYDSSIHIIGIYGGLRF